MHRSAESLNVLARLALLLTLAGCRSEIVYHPDKTTQAATLNALRAAGPWSQAVQGRRCRLLLETDQALETQTIAAAMLIENTGSRNVVLRSSGAPPFGPQSLWPNVDGRWLSPPIDSPADQLATAKTTLEPGGQLLLVSRLLLPPTPGRHRIAAAFRTIDDQTLLMTPPLDVNLAPADWGQPASGIRLRLSSPNAQYSVGDPLNLTAFVHNIDLDPLMIHPPDWSTMDIDVRRDLVIIRTTTLNAQYQRIDRGLAWSSAVPTSLLLAPGHYRIRLELQSPELPATHAPAWHGRAVSNDLPIDVATKPPSSPPSP